MLIYSHEYSNKNFHQYVTKLFCETCNQTLLENEGDKEYLVNKIHRQIDRKIRTKEWVKIVEQNT